MRIDQHLGHLSYCSNINPGESWAECFLNLQTYTTEVKKGLTNEKFGIGLRLSHNASLELLEHNNLLEFKRWLEDAQMYVFTINGFPYGGFHDQIVKDAVHAPDWTTIERLEYTKRLFYILSELLPEGLDGGVSTSPISYRYWHKNDQDLSKVKKTACRYFGELIIYLNELKDKTGKSLHLDLEPEPDGVIETTAEFIDFFNNHLLIESQSLICDRLNISKATADAIIREHFQICFDVCHFAVGFEKPAVVLKTLKSANIKVGRIQISAALSSGRINHEDVDWVKEEFKVFDEPTYLHQAVVKEKNDNLLRYRDLSFALESFDKFDFNEIRTHYHVPVFTEKYGRLVSTQQDIIDTLAVWKETNFTNHLEVETYTWGVLPEKMQIDIVGSIVRELDWVRDTLSKSLSNE